MDAFHRNLLLLLFGSAMLLGLGITGLLAPELGSQPGIGGLMTGPAPTLLAVAGSLGVAAIAVMLIKGAPGEEAGSTARGSEESAAAKGSSAREDKSKGARDDAADPEILTDRGLALLEIEVLLSRSNGGSPMTGVDVPPAALCRALFDMREHWLVAAVRHERYHTVSEATAAWSHAAQRFVDPARVRGRLDGEAASYRLSAIVHVSPTGELGDAARALEALGSLSGDRYLEVLIGRVPGEPETYASLLTIAGELAATSMAHNGMTRDSAPP